MREETQGRGEVGVGGFGSWTGWEGTSASLFASAPWSNKARTTSRCPGRGGAIGSMEQGKAGIGGGAGALTETVGP